ncbi:NADH dehydrogenase [ubiquinone] 1 beta subcomplex subunit 2, mitochondrial-like [Battus philenor]|uniref:NADH dehydrogenase [ubiquinone] 1 beta subcomplex subunit 2, mitochondrial-like n=1 Tax=Battus philenor TaxID=42288 RepID=UPI0035CFD383
MLARALVKRAVLLRTSKTAADHQIKRNGGHGSWTYRMPPPLPSKRATYLAEGLGGLCWYWILYHLATEPEHVYGEWPYIDPSTYCDLELGIPPDSEGPLRK